MTVLETYSYGLVNSFSLIQIRCMFCGLNNYHDDEQI